MNSADSRSIFGTNEEDIADGRYSPTRATEADDVAQNRHGEAKNLDIRIISIVPFS